MITIVDDRPQEERIAEAKRLAEEDKKRGGFIPLLIFRFIGEGEE